MSEKQTHAETDYMALGHYNSHCAICEHFRKPNHCELVKDPIAWQGWCKLFSRAK